MITLFPDQQDLINRTRAAMGRTKSVLLQSATGSGKTLMASWLIAAAQAKQKRAWFCVPRRELLIQTGKTLQDFNIPHSFIASSYTTNPYSKTHVCSIGTLINRMDQTKAPDMAIIDETHFGQDGLDRIIKWLKSNGTWIVGLSATPWKLNGQGLEDWYDEMVCGPSIRWLIDNKRLSEYRMFAPHRPNLSGIKTIAGDYAKGELAARMEHDKVLIGDAVKYYRDHALGRLGVTYCVSRKHSEMTAEKYRDAGVPAVHIDGQTPDDERRRIIRAFAKREILQLCNAQLLTFGFDLAAQVGYDVTVESMTDLAPTKSLSLQMQKWGRVLRYKEYPALIFDHAGNAVNADGTENHGFPCNEREWSLQGRETGEARGGGEKTIPVRTCGLCGFCHRPAPACPSCGNVYPVQYREIDHIEGELAEIKPGEKITDPKKEYEKKLWQLIGVAKKQGRKNPMEWAAKKLTQQIAREKTR